jgi:hypothetical protein
MFGKFQDVGLLMNGMLCRYVSATGEIDMSDLPRRTLPPGNVARLFDIYKAEGGKAKYGTFLHCWKTIWLSHLKFAVPSEHAVCDDCFRLKNAIGDAKSPAMKFTALGDYRAHISAVVRDRDVKDAFWEAPPFQCDKPVLVVCTDGMDQAKWRIPRSRDLKQTKTFQKHYRPRCLVIGVWIAHVGLWISVADCLQPHDSSLTVELVARALERAHARYLELGIDWPRELLVFVPCLMLSELQSLGY